MPKLRATGDQLRERDRKVLEYLPVGDPLDDGVSTDNIRRAMRWSYNVTAATLRRLYKQGKIRRHVIGGPAVGHAFWSKPHA